MATKTPGWGLLGRGAALLALLVIASSALLVACGDDDDDDAASTTTTTTQQTTTTATTTDDDDADDTAAATDEDDDADTAAATDEDDDADTAAATDDADDDSDTAATTADETGTVDDSLAALDDRGYANTSRLVTTQWIEDNLDNDSVLLIDLRNEEQYGAGHIPGAIRVQAGATFQKEIDGVPGLIPPAEEVAASLAALGATPDHTIVFYDARGSIWASRAVWVLAVYGHADVRLLDGDFPLWESQGRTVSTDVPSPSAAEYAFSAAPNEDIIAGWEEVLAQIDDPSSLVCDARSAEEYAGRDVRADRGGHIPNAVNVDWARALAEDGTFLPADELRALYNNEGVESDKTIYTLCQTAVRATHTWFVLTDLLGFESVKVYDGSWIEWGNRTDTPIS
ncbi:MAG: sulfurtransferase [Chloroflexi bacterium]|nr:sulfurtransferase [Chloroflexota bacterium]